MKTTRSLLIAALMAIATIGFSQAESAPACAEKPAPTISVEITLQTALHKSAIVEAMHAQLNPAFLKVERPVYTQRVQINTVMYYISGTYDEWSRFFRSKPASVTLNKD